MIRGSLSKPPPSASRPPHRVEIAKEFEGFSPIAQLLTADCAQNCAQSVRDAHYRSLSRTNHYSGHLANRSRPDARISRARAGNVTLRPPPARRSHTAKPMSVSPVNGPASASKITSASASFPGGLPVVFGRIRTDCVRFFNTAPFFRTDLSAFGRSTPFSREHLWALGVRRKITRHRPHDVYLCIGSCRVLC